MNHTGERPHVCDAEGCNYKSKTASDLTEHKRTHLADRKYKCVFPLCDYASHQKGNLIHHEQVTHSEEAARRRKVEEIKVAKALDAAGISYNRETHIKFCDSGVDGGKFARLDFTIQQADVITTYL